MRAFWRKPKRDGSQVDEDRQRLRRALSDAQRAKANALQGEQVAERGRWVRSENGLGEAVADALQRKGSYR